MTPLINHANIGEVQKTAYLVGVITSVDSTNDTACFTGVGTCPAGTDIPIFYHCEPDSALRSNGALEDAAGAFSEDDEVIIQCEITGANQYVPLRVMGFTDKPKPCCSLYEMFNDDTLALWTITSSGIWNYNVVDGHLIVSGQSLNVGQGIHLSLKNTDVYGVTKDTNLSVSISGLCRAYCLESGHQAIYTYARGYIQFKMADEDDWESTTHSFYFLAGECDLIRNTPNWHGAGNHIFNLSDIIPEGWHMQQIQIIFTLSHGIEDEESWLNADIDFITVCPA